MPTDKYLVDDRFFSLGYIIIINAFILYMPTDKGRKKKKILGMAVIKKKILPSDFVPDDLLLDKKKKKIVLHNILIYSNGTCTHITIHYAYTKDNRIHK